MRSRQKKKAETDLLSLKMDKTTRENNKLKLDNAALRAENQLLKRQLSYFEDLFASKNQRSVTYHQSSTKSSSKGSVQSVPMHVKTCKQHGQCCSSFEDNEAPRGLNDTASEISFVLERNGNSSQSQRE